MILRFICWLGGIIIGAGLATFVIFNRHTIELTLIPFEDAVAMPAYLPVLLAALIGILFGALIIWLKTLSLRLRLFGRNRKIQKLEKTLSDNQKALDQKSEDKNEDKDNDDRTKQAQNLLRS